MKLFFTILAAIPYTIGFFPYLRDIHNKKVKPHIMSWIGWGFITLLAFFAMKSEVFNWAAYIVLLNSISCFAVVIYSFYRNTAVTVFSRSDIIFFTLGIIGIFLWQLFDNPDYAIIFAIVADLSFGIPTIMKTYMNPLSETALPWSMSTLSGFFSIFAISYISFTEIAYPIYLFLFDLIVLLLVIGIIRKRKRRFCPKK